jgi:hypothetical protein
MSDIRQDQDRPRNYEQQPPDIAHQVAVDRQQRDDEDRADHPLTGEAGNLRHPDAPDRPSRASPRVRRAHDAVEALRDDLEPLADKHGFVIGPPTHFGMGFDVFDPNSGLVMTAARPHRSDVGEEAVLLSAGAVVQAVIAARRHQAAVA